MRMRSPVSFFFTNPAILTLLIAFAVPSASAQTPGVTNDSILIGSCSALDGPHVSSETRLSSALPPTCTRSTIRVESTAAK
jgi:hypothetical protein